AAVDEASIRSIPGAGVVRDQELLAVVAGREWDAVRAARELKVDWTEGKSPFPPMERLHDHIRAATPLRSEEPVKEGDLEAAFRNAARVIEAEYEWPFQSHASMGPACALADVRADAATVWTGSQKPHFTRDGVAGMALGMPVKPEAGLGTPAESYGFAAKRLAWEVVAPLLHRGSPLRTAHMRDPVGPEIHFGSEQFIDEIAAATGEDPVAFRVRYLTAPRDVAVVKAAAEKAGWQPRPAPGRERAGNVLRGRGIA